MSAEYRFPLNISNEDYLQYYAGDATVVHARSEQGLIIQFPASALKPWITHQGIHGYFSIKFNDQNKLVSLDKLNE